VCRVFPALIVETVGVRTPRQDPGPFWQDRGGPISMRGPAKMFPPDPRGRHAPPTSPRPHKGRVEALARAGSLRLQSSSTSSAGPEPVGKDDVHVIPIVDDDESRRRAVSDLLTSVGFGVVRNATAPTCSVCRRGSSSL